MKEQERVKIDLELIDIQNMSEEKYKQLCKEKVKFKAFEEMTNKKTKRAFENNIEMALFLHFTKICKILFTKQVNFGKRGVSSIFS